MEMKEGKKMSFGKLFAYFLVISLMNLTGTGFFMSFTPRAHAHEIWVSNQGLDKVQIIGVSSRRILAEIRAGKKPHNLAFTPDGRYAYVANVGTNDVSVIEAATRKVVATIPAGKKAHGVTITPDGKYAYIANVGSNDVTVIATATRKVVTTIPAGKKAALVSTRDKDQVMRFFVPELECVNDL